MLRGLFVAGMALMAVLHHTDSVSVLWVNDMKNMVANQTLKAVFENTRSSLADLTVEEVPVDMNTTVAVESVCNAVNTFFGNSGPDLLLDTTLAGKTSEAVRSLALTLGIPTVSMAYGDKDDMGDWENLTPEQMEYLLHVRPPGDTITMTIRNIVEDNNITNAAIIFDDTFTMDYKYRSLLMNVPVRHLLNRMKEGEANVMEHLKLMAKIDLNNIFLVGTPANIERYLTTASSLGMVGKKWSWIALSKESLDKLNCNCEEFPLLTLSPSPEGSNRVGNLRRNTEFASMSDLDIGFYYDVASAALKAADGISAGDFVMSECAEFTSETPAARTGIDLKDRFASQARSGDMMFGKLSEDDGMLDYDYNVNIHRKQFKQQKLFKSERIGSWSSMNHNFEFQPGKSLAGVAATTMYKVVTVLQAPFVMLKNGTTDQFEGYCIDLINELSTLMGFEYEIYEAPDGQYGNMNEKEEFNGLVRELVDKNADIGLGALAVMAERENVIDFTVPYYDLVGITILMKKPKVPTSLFKFLSVLEDSVWGCILAAYFVTSFLMWVFDRWSPYSYQNNMEKYKDDDEKRYFNFKECLWFCMTSLTPQGGGEAPKNLSGRLVAATWWLFGFIIIASYTANLAAFLTVSRLETPVESLEDLSKQYKIQYSPMNGSSTMTYFERMAYIEDRFYEIWKDMSLNDSMSDYERSKLAVWDYPVSDKYTKMWQSMQEAGLPQSFEEALVRVRKSPSSSEGFAFLGDATDIRYQTLTNCDLQMVGEEFSRKPYALAVQQGSPLKDQFNDAILKLLNQRKLETLKERWWNQNPLKKVCDDDDDSGGGISIYNIGGVFIVIFVGIGLAIITLIVEYWYYKYKKPAMRVNDSATDKKLQVKQAAAASFVDKGQYSTEYRTNGSNIAPVGNPW